MVTGELPNNPNGADPGSELDGEIHDDVHTDTVKQAIQDFKVKKGRRPRILISNVGRNREAKVLAASCGSWGFDVDIGPDIQTPEQAAKMAVENDVHIICHVGSADRETALQLIEALKKNKGNKILVTILGAAPPEGIDRYCRTRTTGDVLVDETTTLTVLRLLEQITGK
jgi:methylmalonyl-CoA mutase cobalamin-binding domain/chain